MELNENIVVKCMQLYESKCTRHGNMLIGTTLSGKTTTWEILQDALNVLYDKEKKEREKNGIRTDEKEKPYRFKQVKTAVINPKAVSLEELYGCMSGDGNDKSNSTWKEGVL
jgi:dynein heavy chain